jgi:phosphoribosylformylglycinamidine cyclo-ligase
LKNLILAPTRVYVKPVLQLVKRIEVKGIAHITGGGLLENVPRVLPRGLTAVLKRGSWVTPPLFTWLRQRGGIDDDEMHRVFNCGIGMVLVVNAADAARAQGLLTRAGETVWRIGTIRQRRGQEAQVAIV